MWFTLEIIQGKILLNMGSYWDSTDYLFSKLFIITGQHIANSTFIKKYQR